MVLFQFLEIIEVFGDYLRVEYLCHAFIMPSTKRNGISALGLTIAAIFTTDPITVSENAVTTEGTLHNLGGTLGIAMPFAAALIGWKLARNPGWSSAKQPLFWATGLALVAFVVSFVSLGVMVSQNDGKFGPEVLVGWPNRFEILAYSVWLMVVAKQALRVRNQRRRSRKAFRR
jgi:hypothetical protein